MVTAHNLNRLLFKILPFLRESGIFYFGEVKNARAQSTDLSSLTNLAFCSVRKLFYVNGTGTIAHTPGTVPCLLQQTSER
jgi:hypothetical protein